MSSESMQAINSPVAANIPSNIDANCPLFLLCVINFILIFALVGFFSWAKWTSLFDLALFIGYYSLVEIFVKNIIILIFPKLIFKTLGAILLLPMILAIVCGSVFPLFIEIESIFGFIITAILCSLIRKFIIEYIDDKKVKKEMKNLV